MQMDNKNGLSETQGLDICSLFINLFALGRPTRVRGLEKMLQQNGALDKVNLKSK